VDIIFFLTISQQFLGLKSLSFVGGINGFAPNYITPINSTIFDLDQHGVAVDVLGLITASRCFIPSGETEVRTTRLFGDYDNSSMNSLAIF
jgi:hypothetical protein